MKAGYFVVSKELIGSPIWDVCWPRVEAVFKELCRKEIGNGMVQIHGESELFDMVPEGATQQYEAVFSRRRLFDASGISENLEEIEFRIEKV